MTRERPPSPPPSVRRVLVAGALVLGGLFLIGASVVIPGMQDDLATAAQHALSQGFVGARVSFDGQDATVRCESALADPIRAAQLVASVRGVHSVRLDPSCGTADGESAGGATSTVPTATTAPAASGVGSTTSTTAAPTTAPATSDGATTTSPVAAPIVQVQLADGQLVLTGTVRSATQRDALVFSLGHAVDGTNISDRLAIDATTPLTDEQLSALSTVALAMPVDLVSGTASLSATGLDVSGVFADDAHRATFQTDAQALGASVELVLRPPASAADAAAVERAVNALVEATPILFEKSGTDIGAASIPTLQRVAGIAKRFSGLHIDVQGYTDTKGNAPHNMTLSRLRAAAVLDALVADGVPAGDLTATGFGEAKPVLDKNGNEIPDKSRRVVFAVTLR